MSIVRHLLTIFAVAIILNGNTNAANSELVYRNFWNPTYHGQRLNYCSHTSNKCGLKIANCYCRMMGYKNADKQIIDHNIGITNDLLSRAQCRGWRCNGFMLIRCVGKIEHKPARSFYYRSRQFVFPRFDHYRVDWCYEDGRGCGQRAASSFCRRMGYQHAQSFKKQEHVPATKALGNQRLCFGPECNAFSHISCYR